MKKTKVYRLEHRTMNLGPWQSSNRHEQGLDKLHPRMQYAIQWVSDFLNRTIDIESFPGLRVDFGATPLPYYWVCGVLDIETLRRWFGHGTDFIKKLEEAGFVVRVFEVWPYQVKHGRSGLQVVFDPLDPECEELPLSILDEEYSDSIQEKAA